MQEFSLIKQLCVADRYYISLRHYIGVDDQVRAEATEELAQENGEEIFVKFHQGTNYRT